MVPRDLKNTDGPAENAVVVKVCLGSDIRYLAKYTQEKLAKVKLLKQENKRQHPSKSTIEAINNRIKELEKMIAEIVASNSKDKQTVKSTGHAFVSFKYERHAKYVLKTYKLSGLKKTIYKVTGPLKFAKYLGIRSVIKGQAVYVSAAPEPADVRWENLGLTSLE